MNLSPEGVLGIRPIEDTGYPGPYSESTLRVAEQFGITPKQVVNARIGAAESRKRENGPVGDLPGDHFQQVEPLPRAFQGSVGERT